MKGDDPKTKQERLEIEELPAVDGEIVESQDEAVEPLEEAIVTGPEKELAPSEARSIGKDSTNSRLYIQYLFLPFIFLTSALLGGLRIATENGEFIFLAPPLICLVFATLLILLFFRSELIDIRGWISEEFSSLRNIANAAVLVSLFAASAQIFNSLVPEQGLAFWVISFCFFWTLWTNLFAEFDTKKLIKSLAALFGIAFVAKYLVLANLVSTEEGSWLSRIWQDPTKEALTYFLDLPKFSSATGYVQFFALGFYMLGLFLINPRSVDGSGKDL